MDERENRLIDESNRTPTIQGTFDFGATGR